jgi:hypothetical protein
MSGNKTTPKKTLKEMEDEIMAQRQAQLVGVSPFARADEIRRERELQAPRQFRVATEADMERRRMMQQPQPQVTQPVGSVGLISTTLLRARQLRAANEKQAKFFSLLEEKYGAIKGNERSYLEAMDRYHNDKDRKKEESKTKSSFDKLEEFRLKQEKKFMKQHEEEQMRREQEQYHQREYDERMRQEQSRQYQQQPGWEQWQREQERQRRHEWEQWQRFQQQQQQQRPHQQQQQQQQQQRSYAYAGPAPEPQSSPPSRNASRFPSPRSRADALAIMDFDARAAPNAREIKLAFNKKALLLHPDKNLDNPEEAGARFKQLHSAFKILKGQGGGSCKKYTKSKKAHKKMHKKMNKRTNKRTNKRMNKRR